MPELNELNPYLVFTEYYDSVYLIENIFFDLQQNSAENICTLMPGPWSGRILISILVTDYIQKRREELGLFSFEYNLLPNLISKLKWLHG